MSNKTDLWVLGVEVDAKAGKAELKKFDRAAEKALHKVEKDAKKTGTAFGSLKNDMLALGAAVGGIIAIGVAMDKLAGFMSENIELAKVQERAETDLAAAMKSRGIFSKESFQQFKDQAAAMQKLTDVGDEVILSIQGMLLQFDVEEKLASELTLSVLDLSKATGTDLRTASLAVGKAVAGNVGSLTRYGAAVSKAKVDTAGASAVLEALQAQFGGRAIAQVATYTGIIKQLSNAWGDVREKVGDLVVRSPAVKAAIRGVTEMAERLGSDLATSKDVMKPLTLGIIDLTITLFHLGSVMELTAKKTGKLKNATNRILDLLLGSAPSLLSKFFKQVGDDSTTSAELAETAFGKYVTELEKIRTRVEKTSGSLEEFENDQASLKLAVQAASRALAEQEDKVRVAEAAYEVSVGRYVEANRKLQNSMESLSFQVPTDVQLSLPAIGAPEEGFVIDIDSILGSLAIPDNPESPLVVAQNNLSDFLGFFQDWEAQYQSLLFQSIGASKQWSDGFASTYSAFAAGADVLDAVLGKNNKFAQGLRKVQAGMLLVTGVISIYEGATKIAKGLFPPNPPLIASGAAMMAKGASAVGQARALGASGSGGGSVGTSGTAGIPTSTAPVGQAVTPRQPIQQSVHVFFENGSFVMGVDDAARTIQEAVDRANESSGRAQQ